MDAELPDFSTLPENIWIHIFNFLENADRFSLSVTCSTLNKVFLSPPVWRRGYVIVDYQHQLYPEESERFVLLDFFFSFINNDWEQDCLIHIMAMGRLPMDQKVIGSIPGSNL